jgi:hypothetical protein
MDAGICLLVAVFVLVLILDVRHRRHLRNCVACALAPERVKQWHPGWEILDVYHRATESDRDVIAVTYRVPGFFSQPDAYLLVAIYHDGRAEELPDDFDSTYSFRGHK